MPRVADTRGAAADGVSGQRGNRTTVHLRRRIVPVRALCVGARARSIIAY